LRSRQGLVWLLTPRWPREALQGGRKLFKRLGRDRGILTDPPTFKQRVQFLVGFFDLPVDTSLYAFWFIP